MVASVVQVGAIAPTIVGFASHFFRCNVSLENGQQGTGRFCRKREYRKGNAFREKAMKIPKSFWHEKTKEALALITASLGLSDILENHLQDVLLALRIVFFFGLVLFLFSLFRKT